MEEKIIEETKLEILNNSTIGEILNYWALSDENYIVEDGKISKIVKNNEYIC